MDKAAAFGLPFFLRTVIPGGLLTLAALPLLIRLYPRLSIAPADFNTASIITALAAGIILGALTDPIYRLYEGLSGWPGWLRESRVRAWQRKVDTMYERQKVGGADYNAVWMQLALFPLNPNGRPTATRATRLGNILDQYERDYPAKRYGLSGPFYWPRLWLLIDKDAREEISSQWAIADGLLLLSAGAVALGLFYVALGIASTLVAPITNLVLTSPEERELTAAGGVGLLLLAHVAYRLSIPAHIANGMLFKAAFDVFRERLVKIKAARPDEIERSISLREQLQFGYTPRPSWLVSLTHPFRRTTGPVPPTTSPLSSSPPASPVLTQPPGPVGLGATPRPIRPVRAFIAQNQELLLVCAAFFAVAAINVPGALREIVALFLFAVALACLRELRMAANDDETGALVLLAMSFSMAYAVGLLAWFVAAAHGSMWFVRLGALIVVIGYGLERAHLLGEHWSLQFRFAYGAAVLCAAGLAWWLAEYVTDFLQLLYAGLTPH